MIKKKTGEIFEFESVRYSIGDWVQCTESSEYAGLSGVIVEIRDGEDRETENPTPDIYCCLQIPKDAELVQQLEARFSGLYGKAVKIKDVPLDCVILSPDDPQQSELLYTGAGPSLPLVRWERRGHV